MQLVGPSAVKVPLCFYSFSFNLKKCTLAMEAQKNLKPLQVCNYKPILKVCMAYLEYGTFQVTLPLNPNPDDWGHI
jgi:hypothetical protein